MIRNPVVPRKRNNKGEKGQTLLEFIFISMAVLSFVVFYLTLSYVFVIVNYIDYASFMAGRAGKAAQNCYDDSSKISTTMDTCVLSQKKAIELTLMRFLFGKKANSYKLSSFQGGAKKRSIFGNFARIGAITVEETPVYKELFTSSNTIAINVSYEVPFAFLPPLPVKFTDDMKKLELISEVLVRREPTKDECVKFFEDFSSCAIIQPNGLGESQCFRTGRVGTDMEILLKAYYDNGC